MMAISVPAFAQGHRGGGDAGTDAGGNSGTHLSDQGRANTNGPAAADRDFGRDRAADRANQQNIKHPKATKTKHAKSNRRKSAPKQRT